MMRFDLTRITDWVPMGSRVLDLGCGDGEFLARLEAARAATTLGIELDTANITAAAANGIAVVQQDMDRGLDNFPDQSFDVVVMAHALQVLHRPHAVLADMVRIGREAIITFPNFGHWRCRLQTADGGTTTSEEIVDAVGALVAAGLAVVGTDPLHRFDGVEGFSSGASG